MVSGSFIYWFSVFIFSARCYIVKSPTVMSSDITLWMNTFVLATKFFSPFTENLHSWEHYDLLTHSRACLEILNAICSAFELSGDEYVFLFVCLFLLRSRVWPAACGVQSLAFGKDRVCPFLVWYPHMVWEIELKPLKAFSRRSVYKECSHILYVWGDIDDSITEWVMRTQGPKV